VPVNNFIRFAEVVKLKSEKRVAAVVARPTVTDCTGRVWFTDLQVQEASTITGYHPQPGTMLAPPTAPVKWHNGVVRGGETVIVFNPGTTTAGMDVYLYPTTAMPVESLEIAQGAGSHHCLFHEAPMADDEFAVKATTREVTRNGQPTLKRGFLPYSAAGDSKHHVRVADKKSARVYVEYTPQQQSEVRS